MIPKELSHYFEEGDHNQVLYYRVSQDKKAGVQDTRVAETIREMLLLQEALGRNFTPSFLSGLPEYQIFQRVLEEQLPEDGPDQLFIADGAYNSDRLEELVSEKKVEIQTTSLTEKAPEDILADFVLNADKTEVQLCPCGKAPTACKYNPNTGNITATMPGNCCASCPHQKECKAIINNKKKKSTVRVTGKSVTCAKQARHFSTEEGKSNANRRNGVEGIMSVMRRKYGIDHIPVFGLEWIKSWIWTTLLSYNLVKYQKYKLSFKKQVMAV